MQVHLVLDRRVRKVFLVFLVHQALMDQEATVGPQENPVLMAGLDRKVETVVLRNYLFFFYALKSLNSFLRTVSYKNNLSLISFKGKRVTLAGLGSEVYLALLDLQDQVVKRETEVLMVA